MGVQLISILRRKFMARFRGDCFKPRAPAFVIAALISPTCFAELDFSLGAASRSYPLSGVIEAETGYGIVLWGDNTGPLYGYTRLKVDGSSALTYNSLGGALEFFPLAFMGARAGGEGIQNDKDYSAYDCDMHQCQGRYYRTYIEGELSLGVGPVFMQARWRRDRWTQKDPDREDFVDPTSGLLMKASGDAQTVYFGILGLKFNENWTGLAVLRYAEGENIRGFSQFPTGVLRYSDGSFSVGVGGGAFASDLKSRDFAAVAFLRWEVAPSVALK
jgi:hypothetical protein